MVQLDHPPLVWGQFVVCVCVCVWVGVCGSKAVDVALKPHDHTHTHTHVLARTHNDVMTAIEARATSNSQQHTDARPRHLPARRNAATPLRDEGLYRLRTFTNTVDELHKLTHSVMMSGLLLCQK